MQCGVFAARDERSVKGDDVCFGSNLLQACEAEKIDHVLTQPVSEAQDADTFVYQGVRYHKEGMSGFYQQENATAAIHAARYLSEHGFPQITQASIESGIPSSSIKRNASLFVSSKAIFIPV